MLIEIDTHCHSLASTHAYSTIKEMAASANENGLKGFALTDHATGFQDAPHIWHFHNLKCLPRKINDMVVLRGIEADIIDYDGTIDLVQQEQELLEWIVASIHGTEKMFAEHTPENIAKAYINVAKNSPLVDVIGHCSTDSFLFDYEPVLKIFKEYEKLVEINESSTIWKKGSAVNCYEILKICKKYEIPIVVNTDCHYCESIGKLDNTEKMITELDFPKELILNSDMNRVLEWVTKKRGINF